MSYSSLSPIISQSFSLQSKLKIENSLRSKVELESVIIITRWCLLCSCEVWNSFGWDEPRESLGEFSCDSHERTPALASPYRCSSTLCQAFPLCTMSPYFSPNVSIMRQSLCENNPLIFAMSPYTNFHLLLTLYKAISQAEQSQRSRDSLGQKKAEKIVI